jgi:hypothetical protein
MEAQRSADVASSVGVTFRRCGWTRACAMSGFVGGDSRGGRSLGGEMGDVGVGGERET